MKKIPILLTALLCTLCFCIPLYSQNAKGFPFYIEWERIGGAGGYRIEVQKRSGEAVLLDEVPPDRTNTELQLPGGPYRFRIITLNKLMREENTTEWIDIEVEPYTSPIVTSVNPVELETGVPVSLNLSAQRMALYSRAALYSPSGKSIPLTIQKKAENLFLLSCPPLEEAGLYALIVLNPPDKSVWKNALLKVRHPEPVPRRISPESIDLSGLQGESIALAVSGRNYSRDIQVRLEPETSARIRSKSSTDILLDLDPTIAPGTYTVHIRNAPDMKEHKAGSFTVFSSREAEETTASQPVKTDTADDTGENGGTSEKGNGTTEKREKRLAHWIGLGAGANADILFGDWAQVYDSPVIGAHAHVDFYPSDTLRPTDKPELAWSFGIRGDYGVHENDGTGKYVRSTMTQFTVIAYPSLIYAFKLVRFRLYAGGGIQHMTIAADNIFGTDSLSGSSLQAAYAGGLSVEISPFRHFTVSLSDRLVYVPGDISLTRNSVSIGLAYMLPIYR